MDGLSRRIDAHHHVWDLDARAQPWIAGAAMAPINRSFDLVELAALADANAVHGTVVVQAVASVTETEELLDLAAATTLVHGVVGYVDLAADDVGDRLDRLRERPSGRWLVGIRAPVQDEPDPDWLVRPEVLRGLRAVAARGLVFDLLIRPGQLPAAVAAVDAVPAGCYVLDHLAKPAIASGDWEPWASDLTRLAARPNVHAKLSGLVTEARWSAWHVHDLAPYAEHALDAFGPERLMFGSDWPVCTLASSYAGVIQATEVLLRGLSASEHSRVFSGTAQHVYSLCPGGGA